MSLIIQRTSWNAYYLRGRGGEFYLTETDFRALLDRARTDGILKEVRQSGYSASEGRADDEAISNLER